MVTPIFLFGYQQTQVSRDEQDVCVVTKVGTILNDDKNEDDDDDSIKVHYLL